MPNILLVLGGPTASGKTSLAVALARHYGTEILSADSRQFYREMRIGNARPTEEELAAAHHHFIADRSVAQPLSAGKFAGEALSVLDHIYKDRNIAIVTGGSGLYLKALAEGLDEFPIVTHAANARVTALYNAEGLAGLQRELATLDPEYFAGVDRQNGRRLERALRICYASGKPYSSFLGHERVRPFVPIYLKLDPPRADLYDRINRRVDEMVAAGLPAEARELYDFRALPVLQTVGYQEWWPYFTGEYDRERAVELIKRNSRRYAKRQITWFGRGNQFQAVANLEEATAVINTESPFRH